MLTVDLMLDRLITEDAKDALKEIDDCLRAVNDVSDISPDGIEEGYIAVKFPGFLSADDIYIVTHHLNKAGWRSTVWGHGCHIRFP